MWEVITTLSEIDTVHTGTLLAEKNPQSAENITIFRVSDKKGDSITLQPKDNYDADSGITVEADELFDRNWWMFKND
ncbi:hypothetical protein FRZ67_11165 [Panacibacter ginsenosidivorans]|uniref:Uncharacterized protein n=1 Tax=Panacibacter ginsenosidivorans TaxID=1813871 RepID=A0A5B8VC29_9BACT|nr:hypothetical protein [Panacibacter ginsenosidivorans]QEC67828.1 hypothetical protein FRZ67_11165 [Panacibacter ginsenosidivorans]